MHSAAESQHEAGESSVESLVMEDEHSFPRPAHAWYVVAVLFLAGSVAIVDRIVISMITPALQADLGLRDSQLGLLQGMAFALFLARMGVGAGEASLNPCVTSLISDYFPQRTRPHAIAAR